MRRTAYLLIAVVFCFAASAQVTSCSETESILLCWTRVINEGQVTVQEEETTEDLAEENTGVPEIGSAMDSSLKDFLTLFTASVETATLTEGENKLTLDLNVRPPGRADSTPFKVQAVFATPELSADVKEKLTGTALTSAEESLDDLDDVTVNATYNRVTRNFGRALSPHRRLFQLIVRDARTAEGDPTRSIELIRVLQRFDQELPFKGHQDPRLIEFGQLSATQRTAIEAAVIAAAEEAKAASDAYRARTRANGIVEFRELLNQQPQLYFTISRRQRNELAGANETAIRASLEWGGRSLRNFYSDAAGTCSEEKLALATTDIGSQAAKDCLAAFRAFARDSDTRRAIASTGRGSISLEYSGVDERDFDLDLLDPAVNIKSDDSESLVVKATWGWVVTAAPNREGRFDINASLQNYTGDADRDNRIEASAVYSQKLTDTLTIPLGIVYANQDKYLPEVTKQLSMHVGLVYKVPDLSGFLNR